jgi:hypothetical protein
MITNGLIFQDGRIVMLCGKNSVFPVVVQEMPIVITMADINAAAVQPTAKKESNENGK